MPKAVNVSKAIKGKKLRAAKPSASRKAFSTARPAAAKKPARKAKR